MKKSTLIFVITFGIAFEHNCMATVVCPTGNVVYVHKDTENDTNQVADLAHQIEGEFERTNRSTLSEPYAFNIINKKDGSIGQNGYLQITPNQCMVCGDDNEIELSDTYHFTNAQYVGIRDKNGRFTNFFQCVSPQWRGGIFSGKNTSRAFWIKKGENIITVQCNNEISNIPTRPNKHGGKAYYVIGLDIKSNTSQGMPGNIYTINDNVCYYYFCDDGYEYVDRNNTCINTEKRNKARESIPKLEKLVKQLSDQTTKNQKQEGINQLKAAYGLD